MLTNPSRCRHQDQDHLGINHQGYAIFWCTSCGAHYNADLSGEPGEGWTYPEPSVTQGPPPPAQMNASTSFVMELCQERHSRQLDAHKQFIIELRQDVAELMDLKSKLRGVLDEQTSRRPGSQGDS